MGKFRVRVSHKGKRWKKGQSSSSNPTARSFRDAARSNFFQENLGGSSLTKEAVEKHAAFNVKGVEEPMEEELLSLGGQTFKTFDTFASDFSACSNKSFSKLLNHFNSNSALHKEMLAVLAAVTEVIKSSEGKESPTEYFAALMTALEAEENTDQSILAILSLLSMGIKSVPVEVLRLKFAEASKLFLNLLAKYAQSEDVSILRPILGCLSVLLRAQEAAVWSNSSTLQVLKSILAFTTFSKPKIRKAAQHGILVIVKVSKITTAGLSCIGDHCIQIIEGISTGGVTSALHILTLLKDILYAFPKKELKACCESILKVMTMNNVLLSSCGLQALHGMFLGHPEALPPARNARLITALYDYQPPHTDCQPTQAWVAVMQEAYINLAKTDLKLCMANLGKFFSKLIELYLTEKPECLSAATHALEAVIIDCLGPASLPEVVNFHRPQIAKIVTILQACLGFQYHTAWTHILHLMVALFKACGATCSKTVLPCVRALAELRDSYQFTYVNELDMAVGSAVRSMGPELVLQAIPLEVPIGDDKRDFKRSWLLPVLKDNIKSADIKFFTEYFLPLATICRNESDRLKKNNDQVGCLSYDLMQTQIWSLLPSFSSHPSDITSSFPVIAKALGGVLTSRKDLRMIVMASLRKLISFCIESESEEDKKTMGKFGKNYIPILFNIYTTAPKGSDEEGTRLAALETVKVYLKVCDEPLWTELFTRAFSKLQEPEQTPFMKESLLDLLKVLLPYQKLEEVEKFYKATVTNINTVTDHKQQKKYYRVLEEICVSESEACRQFLKENLTEIQNLLLNSLSKAASSSKGARLKCLSVLVDQSLDPASLVENIVPEAVLCVKDVNSKCRETAYILLGKLADLVPPDEFVTLVMAGLTGKTNLMACTLLALAGLVHHYREKLPPSIEEQLLYNVGILSMCATREVVSAALSFVKVYIQTYDKDKIARYVPNLVDVLSKMNEDCKRHCRTKTRDIIARLVRWYGCDSILRLVPAKDNILKARVKNLGKIHERKKRIREEQRQNKQESTENVFTAKGQPKTIEEILAESDSDMEHLDEEETKHKKNKSKAWITETADDIVDFTDAATTKKISASKPQTKTGVASVDMKKKKKNSTFKTAPDGRLIIADDSDSEDDKRKKKKFPMLDSDSDVDDYEPSEGEADEPADEQPVSRKRAMSISSTSTGVPPLKYQAGGSGIHRPINKMLSKNKKKKNPESKNESGSVYQAKKAGGDMKRKGLPDPYAYVPLKRDALNRRKKMKHMGKFEHFVKSARKGALKGTKMKMKRKK